MTIAMIFGLFFLCLAVFAVWLSTMFYVLLAITLCAIVSFVIGIVAWSTGQMPVDKIRDGI